MAASWSSGSELDHEKNPDGGEAGSVSGSDELELCSLPRGESTPRLAEGGVKTNGGMERFELELLPGCAGSNHTMPCSSNNREASEASDGAVATDDTKYFVKSKRVAASVRHDNEAIIPNRPAFDQQNTVPVDRSDLAPVAHGVVIKDLIPVGAMPQTNCIAKPPKVVKRCAPEARMARQDECKSIPGEANLSAGRIVGIIVS